MRFGGAMNELTIHEWPGIKLDGDEWNRDIFVKNLMLRPVNKREGYNTALRLCLFPREISTSAIRATDARVEDDLSAIGV
jgi:hypothetical protein